MQTQTEKKAAQKLQRNFRINWGTLKPVTTQNSGRDQGPGPE